MLSIIFAASCKKKTRNSTVEELLHEIDCLTESYKSVIKSSAPKKQYAKHVFRFGSTDNKTGKRTVHCPNKIVMSAKKKMITVAMVRFHQSLEEMQSYFLYKMLN